MGRGEHGTIGIFSGLAVHTDFDYLAHSDPGVRRDAGTGRAPMDQTTSASVKLAGAKQSGPNRFGVVRDAHYSIAGAAE